MKQQTIEGQLDPMPWTIKSTQEWFAGVITHPLGEHGAIDSHGPSGCLISEEAARYIVPSPTLRPHQRIQIYNQQYWWRLLRALHTNFPLTVRLFGSHAFNEKVGIPYLLQYPPRHWSLSVLGKELPHWLQESYRAPDRSLVHHAAVLDLAFTNSLTALQSPSLDLSGLVQGGSEQLHDSVFYLQPHIHLFAWEYDLIAFRSAFLREDIDYWVEHRFPELPKGRSYYFILYRNERNHISWREMSQSEWCLLDCLKKGATVAQLCDCIEMQDASSSQQMEMAEHLERWLQEWTWAKWLTLSGQQEGEYA